MSCETNEIHLSRVLSLTLHTKGAVLNAAVDHPLNLIETDLVVGAVI